MKMGTILSPCPYDAGSPPRVPIGKAATPYDFALRLTDAAFDFAGWSACPSIAVPRSILGWTLPGGDL